MLLAAACAVLAGARSYLAIGRWARHAPQDTLARLGFHARGPLGVRVAALVLDRAPGAGRGVSRRTRRPARAGPGRHGIGRGGWQECSRLRTDTTTAAHLLSAITSAGRTVSQLRVPDKTNEITGFTALLAPFDLTGTVVTADALHTQREYAKWLVEAKNAHYLLVVKAPPNLHAAVKAPLWKEVTARRLRP
ncbi:transposase [Streptomyces murinus]|uniref:transposase n=1 Tax=Streptomyces murinus TaxID=33900 RepID=UPI0037F148F7